ncbi:MAG: MBL fold metallo-hydrolase [Parabacteroides sp.]|nr:MBL fold metallo-hydrolase [Parabacteroides sp.]
MTLDLFETGRFYADGGAMFGAIPKTAWRRRYPCDEYNSCLLAMRCMLVRPGNGRVVLVDAGCGDKQLPQLGYYRFTGLKSLEAELDTRGVSCEQVTDVVLTHLHFDHCGAATLRDKDSGLVRPAFPNAVYWVGEAQWQNFIQPHPLEKDSYFTENMLPVVAAGKLRLVTEDTELCRGVRLRLYNGHTPGQLAVYADTATETVVFAGDVVPLAASVSLAWISAYDLSPLVSYSEKIRMLDEAVTQGQRMVFCHDTYTVSARIKKSGSFYKAYDCEQEGGAPAPLQDKDAVNPVKIKKL